MDEKFLRDALLEVIEDSLDAQLRAVRRIRAAPDGGKPKRLSGRKDPEKGRSQVDMAYDILLDSGPLHVNDLLVAIKSRFGIEVDRESLVSALSKRVARADRFERTDRNTFALIPSARQ